MFYSSGPTCLKLVFTLTLWWILWKAPWQPCSRRKTKVICVITHWNLGVYTASSSNINVALSAVSFLFLANSTSIHTPDFKNKLMSHECLESAEASDSPDRNQTLLLPCGCGSFRPFLWSHSLIWCCHCYKTLGIERKYVYSGCQCQQS